MLDLEHKWPYCDYVDRAQCADEDLNSTDVQPQVQPHSSKAGSQKRRRTIFYDNLDYNKKGVNRSSRQCTFPVPKRRQSILSDWMCLEEKRCVDPEQTDEPLHARVVCVRISYIAHDILTRLSGFSQAVNHETEARTLVAIFLCNVELK